MITLKNTTDKQVFYIPKTTMETEFVSGYEAKDVSITGNGTYQILPSKGKKALTAVNLDVDVSIDTTPFYEEGFKDGEAEQKSKQTSIDISSNGVYEREDGYNKVNVRVVENLQSKDVEYTDNGEYVVEPDSGYTGLEKVNVSVNYDTSNVPFVVPGDMRFAYSNFTEFPDNWDWSEIEQQTNLDYLFYNCDHLKEVPTLNFVNLTSTSNMFSYTTIVTNPQIDTSKVKSMLTMFGYCTNLKEVKDFDTSSATKIDSLFTSCSNLQSVSELDTSNITSNFYSYNPPFNNCSLLRNFEGFKGLKVNMYLDKCYSLSYESLMNVINKLADGVSGKTLYLSQDCVNQLSDDDIAIATNKGWSISPARTITEPVVVTDLSQIPSSTYNISSRTYDFSQYSGSWNSGTTSKLPCKSNLYFLEADISGTTNASYMLVQCNNLRFCKITGTGNVTNMSYAFNAPYLTTLDASELDTSNVTDMTYMFGKSSVNNSSLEIIGISSWDVSNVTKMVQMFDGRILEPLDLSRWTYADGVDMMYMFNNTTIKSVHLGDISNVGCMRGLFYTAKELESVTMLGCPADNLDVTNMFNLVKTTGTLYYDYRYDYSKIIAQLPSTWTAVPLS